MKYAKKMIIIPEERFNERVANISHKENYTTSNGANLSSKKKHISPLEKFTKIIQIVLKLANISGYNEDGQVRNQSGSFLKNSNVNLLSHAVSFGKSLIGENEFISLLHEAKVPLHLIINENWRNKLKQLHATENFSIKTDSYTNMIEGSDNENEFLSNAKNNKRKREQILQQENFAEDEVNSDIDTQSVSAKPKRRKIAWEQPIWKQALEKNLSDEDF